MPYGSMTQSLETLNQGHCILTVKKGEALMKDENEIKIAWKLWHLVEELNDLIWNRYEDEFLQRHLQEQEQQYRGSLTDYMNLDDT